MMGVMKMKRILSILLVFVICCMFTACGRENNHEGQSKTPSGSSIMKGKNYQDVIEIFEENGFTNVQTEKIDDLITGWLTKDGEVEEVSVGGNVEYSADEWVKSDTKIVIRYHTFPEQNIENEETKSSPIPNKTEKNEDTKNNTVENETNEIAETKEGILNISNSSELAAILTTKNEFDPLIKQFANKYMGQKIEFDGYTADVARNGNYKTRFNYLIYVGDYNSSPIVGPQFQIKDVNYYDLHLSGSNVPDTFGVGLNIHIVAEVVSYSENSGLFQIKPVKITIR